MSLGFADIHKVKHISFIVGLLRALSIFTHIWVQEGRFTSLVAQTVKRLPTMRETWVQSLNREDLLEKGMATHSSILPGKSHGQRSLVGYSPWSRKESDTTVTSLSLWLDCGLPRWRNGKESACQCRSLGFDPWVGKILWRRKRQPTPAFLPGKSHGQRSLAGLKLDATWQLSTTRL